MCTHPFAKKALTLYLAHSEGHERYFGCNLLHRKVLASSHQHLMAEAPEGKIYGPLVLANRYDGIDLVGNACRLLVMDDLPQGTTNYDVFRMNAVAGAAVNSLLARRIEQGIGRGTRGGADYCVIMLVGSKLVGWIGRKRIWIS